MKTLPSPDMHRQLDYRRGAPASGAPVTYRLTPEHEPAAPDTGAIQSVTSFLWRRKFTIAAAAVVGLSAGLLVSRFMSPVYRAHTSLQLQGFNQDALRDIPVAQVLPNASAEDYLQNEVKVLESDTLAHRVAVDLGPELPAVPATDTSFVGRLRAMIDPAPPVQTADPERARSDAVQKALDVRTSLQSQVIDVYFDAPTSRMAADGANAAASEFIAMNREARNSLVQDTTEWLNKQAAELKAKLESSNAKLQAFALASGLVFDGAQSTPAQDRLRQLTDALTRAEADRATKQARWETLSKNPDELLSDGLTNSPLRQYQEDQQTLRRQLADLRAMYTPESPKVQRVQAQLAEADAAVQKERKDLLQQAHAEYVAAASLEDTLKQSLSGSLSVVQNQTEKERQYDVLKNDVQTTQQLYNTVMEKSKEAGAASSLRTANVQVIDSALPPLQLYSPNLPLNMAIGFALGTLGGIGLVLLGTKPSKVKQPGELMFMDLPELGAVPSAKSARELEAPSRDLVLSGPRAMEPRNSLLKESFRAVLTSILLNTRFENDRTSRSRRARGQVLVVSSIDMMEGKTTIVTNLGVASAERRREILLIDADLRRPRLHERFHLPNEFGLTNVLERTEPIDPLDASWVDALIQSTEVPHLRVLTSGPTDGASPDRLYSTNWGALLKYLERRFDLVFIDTPPMAMYSDARMLGRMAEGLVMVVRANTRSRDELRAVYQKLVQDQIPVIGTVLNDWAMQASQARAYSRYYSHYQQSS